MISVFLSDLICLSPLNMIVSRSILVLATGIISLCYDCSSLLFLVLVCLG